MKTKFFFLAVLTAFAVLFVSCSKDDEGAENSIVGTWIAYDGSETITFNKKGTFSVRSSTGGASIKMSGAYTYNYYTGNLELMIDANSDEYVLLRYFVEITGKTMTLTSTTGETFLYKKK